MESLRRLYGQGYIVIGDVVEIYHPEEEYSRLLLQVNNLQEDFGQKDSVVSIEQSIAAAFQLKAYKNVIINKVDKEVATLINDDHLRTVCEISDILGLGRSVIHNILISELQMNKVDATLAKT
ncbi:DEPD5-like protein [Mya arenaria]|uniref:DEPD5-like protein n=1 Tax=Mya arenaria TaxID=6604 RepID=A0ABY7DXY1_MYAAR|nr:DEPD5-like protein [Mya arenaria]